jgi:hypothetical protein
MRIIICRQCGEPKEHCGHGLCRQCWNKHAYAPRRRDQWRNDPEFRARGLEAQKNYRLKQYEALAEKTRAWRADNPEKAREIARRYRGNRKYRLGTPVEYELVPGHWILGIVLENPTGSALVRFATYEARICYRLLRPATGPVRFHALPIEGARPGEGLGTSQEDIETPCH